MDNNSKNKNDASTSDGESDPNSIHYWLSHFSYLGRCLLNFYFFPVALMVYTCPTTKLENQLWNLKLNLSRDPEKKSMDFILALKPYKLGFFQKPSPEFTFMLGRLNSAPQLTPAVKDHYHYWVLRKTNKELFRYNPIQYMVRDFDFDIFNYILNTYFIAVPAYFLQKFKILDLNAAKEIFTKKIAAESKTNAETIETKLCKLEATKMESTKTENSETKSTKTEITETKTTKTEPAKPEITKKETKNILGNVIKKENWPNLFSTPARKRYWFGCLLYGLYSLPTYYVHDDKISLPVRKKVQETKPINTQAVYLPSGTFFWGWSIPTPPTDAEPTKTDPNTDPANMEPNRLVGK